MVSLTVQEHPLSHFTFLPWLFEEETQVAQNISTTSQNPSLTYNLACFSHIPDHGCYVRRTHVSEGDADSLLGFLCLEPVVYAYKFMEICCGTVQGIVCLGHCAVTAGTVVSQGRSLLVHSLRYDMSYDYIMRSITCLFIYSGSLSSVDYFRIQESKFTFNGD